MNEQYQSKYLCLHSCDVQLRLAKLETLHGYILLQLGHFRVKVALCASGIKEGIYRLAIRALWIKSSKRVECLQLEIPTTVALRNFVYLR